MPVLFLFNYSGLRRSFCGAAKIRARMPDMFQFVAKFELSDGTLTVR